MFPTTREKLVHDRATLKVSNLLDRKIFSLLLLAHFYRSPELDDHHHKLLGCEEMRAQCEVPVVPAFFRKKENFSFRKFPLVFIAQKS